MKPQAYIINTARSGLIDVQHLLEALKERRIGGAGIDVFEKEPLLPNDPLLEMDNVTITAHLAGTTRDAMPRSASILAMDILRLMDGERAKNVPVRNLVDPVDWQQTFGSEPNKIEMD